MLRRLPSDFIIRGDHSTLYPVELPPWLPTDTLEKMVHLFKLYLYRELVAMKDPEASESGHSHTPSLESDSGYSTTTSMSINVVQIPFVHAPRDPNLDDPAE